MQVSMADEISPFHGSVPRDERTLMDRFSAEKAE
jgi:hypothetical protein